MSERPGSTEEVQKSKRQARTALVLLLFVVLALGGAFYFFDGATLVADLISGDTVVTLFPEHPGASSVDETGTSDVAADPGDEATASEDTSTTADEDAAGDSDAEPSDTSTSESTVAAGNGPPSDALTQMFYEQVSSRETIGDLVADKFSSFSLGTVTNNGTTASVPVTANYKAGGSISGTMVLRDYSDVWYFSSITREGNSGSTVKTVPADTSVTSAIVYQTESNQGIPTSILEGRYDTITMNSVSIGSGTAAISITLSGDTEPPMSGQIVCISKTIGGTKYWFITSFREA